MAGDPLQGGWPTIPVTAVAPGFAFANMVITVVIFNPGSPKISFVCFFRVPYMRKDTKMISTGLYR